MKPESIAFLRKAREFLRKAGGMLERWPDEAGRAAYLAAFRAAQAFIFEHTGNPAKTHTGVHTQFARLAKDDARVDAELRAFLGRAYNLKAVADYETSPGVEVVPAQAATAIRTATRFVDRIESLTATEDPVPRPD